MDKHEKITIDFYKAAFCVDGEVKILDTIIGFKIAGIVELNDSKRGKFYVGRLIKED